jgi:multidrug efflux pump subunit AcrA (membrane-fusion protein)
MIDATNIKAPGWERIVGELSAPCADDKTYLDRLLRVMARVAAARQAVLVVPLTGDAAGAGDVRVISMWPAAPLPAGAGLPPAGDAGDKVVTPTDTAAIEFVGDVRSAAYAALESGQSRVFSLEKKSAMYDAAPNPGYVLAIPLRGAGGMGPDAAEANRPIAAVTLLIEPRSKQAVQSTLAMAEVLAGYVAAHAARQQLRRTQTASAALDLATRLIGAVNSAPSFRGAALQLANDIAKQLPAERVALGWVARDKVQVVAISDTEHFDRRTAMVQRLEAAMDECLDQEQAVLHPPPPAEQDVLLGQAIAHAHRELASGNPALRVASVPLRDGDAVLGVLTIEAAPRVVEPGSPPVGNLDAATVELIQSAMDLTSPVMKVRRSDDRNLALRAWDSTVRAGAWLVGPRHTVWKLVALVVLIFALFVTFFTTTYRVGSEFTLQPRTKQVISVPFDGLVRSVPTGTEAGAVVEAGQLLVQMDTTELELAAIEARQKITQAEKEMHAARAENKVADAQRAAAAMEAAQAQLAAAESRIAQSRIVSPIAGTIIAGRINDRIGSSVKLGDKLFEVAPLSDIIAVARVDERDISLIAPGTKGRIATRSHPDTKFDVVVETVVPLAAAADGKNLFEVRARIVNPATAWMRPGMEGVARLDAGEHSLLYIGTRRVISAVRLWLW